MQPIGELGAGVTTGGAVSAVTGATGSGAGTISSWSNSDGGVSGCSGFVPSAAATFDVCSGGGGDESERHSSPLLSAN